MSGLTDLIAQAKAKDADLGRELEREFKTLASRKAFGLNFERHTPETVELPGRPIRKGDKVRVLPPRASTEKGDKRLWKVTGTTKANGKRVAQLDLIVAETPEVQTVAVEDLIVVAEFRDYIYPGLVCTGKVERGGDKPFHTVINGENFHALEALTFTHRGKVDVIYIDPPYNTGAKDWKYNNDYVEGDDLYRHSKWLAFMERRLKLASELLHPDGSVLIVTIDEKEVHRLGLLLEQLFPEALIQMVSTQINPANVSRRGAFGRNDEYIFNVMIGGLGPARVVLGAEWVSANPAVPQKVWDKLLSLPSKTLPKKQAQPIKRLTALAHELAADGVLPDAGKVANAHLHALLDKAQTDYAEAIEKARKAVLTVEGKTGRAAVGSTDLTFDNFVEDADLAVIEDAYKRAARMISPDVAKTYSEYLAEKNEDTEEDEEALVEAHTDVAAIGLVPAIKDDLEAAAEALANEWLTTQEATIRALSDERQDVYRELRELSANPLDVSLAMPRNSLQPTVEVMEDGTEAPLPSYKDHLLCDASGLFPVKIRLNDWELEVLSQETSSSDFIAWYRNPSSASPESLGIVYPIDEQESILRPDFIFFTKDEKGAVRANIVNPHGDHLADSLPKLVGLANYAEAHANSYGRIVSVSKSGGVFRCLDLKDPEVREAIKLGPSAKALFGGQKAKPYTT